MNYSIYSSGLRVFLILLFVSFQTTANDLIVMKYEYGKRGWDGVKYEKGSIYPLPTYSPRYLIADIENINVKSRINVTLDISIKKKQDSILATVRLENHGDMSIFIPEITFSALSMNFLITTDNIALRYLGGKFDYRGDFCRNDWIELHPGKIISLTQVLNDNYEFLPGKRLYAIGSLEYTVVNEKWFIDGSIYNKLVSITTPKFNDCHIKNNVPHVLKKRWLCMSNVKEKNVTLENLLGNLGFHNFYSVDTDNSFNIRTNQIFVEIDGDKISSIYEKN